MNLNKLRIFRSIGYKPHPLQLEVHESDAQRRVLACGVRWGKTKCAAAEAIAASLAPSDAEHPRRGWVAAPTYDLADKVFREIVLTFHERLRPLIVKLSESERLIVVRNAGSGVTELRGKSAENPVSLLGEGLDFLIVDEAARLKPDVFERYLAARLIDKKGWALLISTPKGKGWFYDAFRRWPSWNAPSSSNPHLDAAEIEAVRMHIPERVFAQEYLAQFIEGAGQVFRNVRDLATLAEYPTPEGDCIAGLDLARTEDYTVLVILDEKRRVVHVDRFTRIDWTQQVGRVRAALERFGDPVTYVDSTGSGEPIYERLAEAGCRVEAYHFTNASKAALVNNLALALEQRDLELPSPELCFELIDEMEAYEFSITEAGTVRTGAPPGMHDDCVIALALAAWGSQGGKFEASFV